MKYLSLYIYHYLAISLYLSLFLSLSRLLTLVLPLFTTNLINELSIIERFIRNKPRLAYNVLRILYYPYYQAFSHGTSHWLSLRLSSYIPQISVNKLNYFKEFAIWIIHLWFIVFFTFYIFVIHLEVAPIVLGVNIVNTRRSQKKKAFVISEYA